jgi:hypothetical protein
VCLWLWLTAQGVLRELQSQERSPRGGSVTPHIPHSTLPIQHPLYFLRYRHDQILVVTPRVPSLCPTHPLLFSSLHSSSLHSSTVLFSLLLFSPVLYSLYSVLSLLSIPLLSSVKEIAVAQNLINRIRLSC